MLQISNIDDKSEWNINEAHIIIPMIDGNVTVKESEKMLTSTLTLSSLEGGDQAILTNTLEHSFVIGLDKNLFETPNYKSDLVIIQNSDWKLHSSNTDLKNPVAYTISYVDHDKGEILWQSSVQKDRICANDKAILEVRDVLNYDDSVHGLQKTEQQINLNNVDTDHASQVAKTDNEILVEKTITDVKSENKSQFINYFEAAENTEADHILQHLDKSSENLGLEDKKLHEFTSSSNSNVEDIYKLDENTQEIIFPVTESAVEFNETQSLNLVEYNKTAEKVEISVNKNKDKAENIEGEKINEGGSNSLPEKSLPLKKKAKMKRTLTSHSSESQKSLLKQDVSTANQQVGADFLMGRKIKQPLTNTNFLEEEKPCQSNFVECVINKVTKQRKMIKFKTNPKKFKRNTDCCLQDGKSESNKLDDNNKFEEESAKIKVSEFNENKVLNINDLVDFLRKCRMINATVWQTLNSGLKEMNVDILKEMNAAKKNEKCNKNTSYSPQLKAFALVLYFKQPAAFNYLSQIYKNGWPSFNVIKKWKRQMNSCQRPNFVRSENCKT